MRLEARATDPDAFRGTLEAEAAKPPSWFATRLAEDAVFGAFTQNALVGMAGYSAGGGSRDGEKGRVWTVYVRPDHRGAGVGAALMGAVIAHARTVADRLHLSVMADNRAARTLYEQVGFVLVSTEPEDAPGGRPEAHYVRLL